MEQRSEDGVLVDQIETTGTGTRRERLRIMMRQDILDAARQIVQNSGFKDLSMRALARAVGVTAPTLYDYFASKDAVLDALYLEGVRGLRRDFDEIAACQVNSAQKLNKIAHAYRHFSATQTELFMLVFSRVDAAYRPGETEREECKALMIPILQIVVEAIENGSMRPCDPLAAGHFLWMTVHGFVMLEVNMVLGDCPPDEQRAQFEECLEMLADGFRPIVPV